MLSAFQHFSVRHIVAGTVTVASVVTLACGGADKLAGPASVAYVTVSLASPSVVVGSTTQALATTRDIDGTVLLGRSISWTSSDTDVASVSSTGEVTTLKPGSAQITATSEGKYGSAMLAVIVPPVASVAVTLGAATLPVGSTMSATAALADANGNSLTGRAVSWSTSDATVATVSDVGVVTAVKVGNATITATSEGKTGSAAVAVIPPPVNAITVKIANAQLHVGETSQATATVTDANGNPLADRPIVWSTDNEQVATVSDKGVVTGVAPGSATITATSEGKTGSASVSVALKPISSITVVFADPQIRVGATTKATAVAKDENGNVLTGRPVVWTTENADVATVNAQGIVTGVKAGAATITATSEGKTGSASISVEQIPISSITVSFAEPAIKVGASTKATAVAKDENGNVLTGRPVVWSTSNADIATVSAQGIVTGVKPGSATITATSEGKSGSATITVSSTVSGVVVVLPQPGLSVGYSIQASDTVKDDSGNPLSGYAVTWSSSNTSVATVNQSGVVTGVAPGSADIIATTEGKSGSATIGIIVIKQHSLTAGSNHTCAISVDGDAYCWGYNDQGQLGDGTTTERLAPVLVSGGLKFSAITAKIFYTYALTSDGRLVCWGACPGSATLTPRAVSTNRAIYFLGDGLDNNCGIGVGNVAYCWGDNSVGQLGIGSTGGTTTVPDAPVAGGYDFVDIASQRFVACALASSGKAYCWGSGALGAQSASQQSSVPVAVSGSSSFMDITAGGSHACGLATDGNTYCWGQKIEVGVPYANCENGANDTGCYTPTLGQTGHLYTSISSGAAITCGLTSDGDPYCWGGLDPYPATGTSFRHWSELSGSDPYALVKYRTVSPGFKHVCATSTEGDIYCMNHQPNPGNRNMVGDLGDGTTDISREVRKVIGGIKFRTP